MIALAFLLLLSAPPEVGADLGFSQGMVALAVDPGPLGLRAEACRRCHEVEYQAWSRSRHAQATSNSLFAQGHKVEPRRRCVRCHSPLVEQQRDVRAGVVMPGSLGAEGVNCAVCHLRDGLVLSARSPTRVGTRAHAMRVEPSLRSSTFCGACHQFRFEDDAGTGLTEVPAQMTLDEWREWGGKATCQRCHMPSGDHAFVQGAHDVDALRRALVVELEGSSLVLSTRGVGHRFPSGDVYRHLVVEAERDGIWTEIATAGLKLGFEWKDGVALRTRERDDRLAPGERRSIALPADATKARVRYRYTAFKNVERGLDAADYEVELAEITLR